MFKSYATLEEKTQTYWNISKAYNGQAEITTECAIGQLGTIEDTTNCQRKLAMYVTELLDEIIGCPWIASSTDYNYFPPGDAA